jgi:hypothetical protein
MNGRSRTENCNRLECSQKRNAGCIEHMENAVNKKTGCHECQNVRWECAVGNEENLGCKRFVRSVPVQMRV